MTAEGSEKYRILLVEDEETLAIGLEYNLTEEGYKVEIASDGKEAIKLFEDRMFDLIILDIMLPYLNGFEVAEAIRNKEPQVPILMLTAKTGANDKIRGLELGADDYITKPFNLKELLLRIKRMLERKSWYKSVTQDNPIEIFGSNEINFSNMKCNTDKGEIKLTYIEAMLLKYLIEREGNIVSREELLENVWHLNPSVETRTVDNFIARLRKHFEKDVSKPRFIKSVRGAGYVFERNNN